jgi:hypothetical protein
VCNNRERWHWFIPPGCYIRVRVSSLSFSFSSSSLSSSSSNGFVHFCSLLTSLTHSSPFLFLLFSHPLILLPFSVLFQYFESYSKFFHLQHRTATFCTSVSIPEAEWHLKCLEWFLIFPEVVPQGLTKEESKN